MAASEAELRRALEALADWDCVRDLNGREWHLLREAVGELVALRAIAAAARVVIENCLPLCAPDQDDPDWEALRAALGD